MQSRFILMEGGTVASALLLMTASLAATAGLIEYRIGLRIVLLALGIFPIAVMIWFQRAHARHIWAPLERLRAMMLEVKRGNLNIRGETPSTVELGSVTASFLAMASELREMRDSLEEKVKQRAIQLESAHKDLLRAAKLASLGQLVSGVAHEINNPLTSILGFSEVVLSRDEIQPSVKTHVQTIRTEAMRLKYVVANLSGFARRAPQHVTRFDLRTVPDRLIQLRAYQLAANNISLHYRRAERPIWIQGEPDSLLQALLQLTLNSEQAIRRCRDQGEILLVCEESAGQARLTVEDNGCGIPEEMRERIFDPFFCEGAGANGVGLGLSICHAIVEQHGGTIEAESGGRKGTLIRILLPMTSQAEPRITAFEPCSRKAPAAARGTASLVERTARRHRYLVIDDEPEILHLVSAIFEKDGTEIVTVQDSARLTEMLADTFYDAVLCDLKMPGPDGLAVLRMLRESRPELAQHFLLMTGNLADADKAAIELERVPILLKPFTLARLRQAVEQVAAKALDAARQSSP